MPGWDPKLLHVAFYFSSITKNETSGQKSANPWKHLDEGRFPLFRSALLRRSLGVPSQNYHESLVDAMMY